VTIWVLLVIPLLVLQIGMILLHLPRIVATAWDSLGKQYDTVTEGFGHGDFLGAGIGIVQALILVLPLLGITLSFGRLGRRMAVKGWKATEGSAVARLALCAVTAAAVGGLAYTWLPNGDYTPIRRGERGTLGEGLRAVAKVPTGRPSVVPAEKAAERLPEGDGTATTTSTTLARSAASTTVPSGSATTTPAASDRPSATTTTVRVRDTVAPTTTVRPATTTTAGG
jgi:putative peptide zinc metalloprotease protein